MADFRGEKPLKGEGNSKEVECIELGCENGWAGDAQQSWPRHPELQSSWFLPQPEGHRHWEHWERQNIVEQGMWGLLTRAGRGVKG